MTTVYHASIPVDLAAPSRQRLGAAQFYYGDNNSHVFMALVADSTDPEAGLRAGTVSGTALRADGVTVVLEGEKGSAVEGVTFANGQQANATPCSVTLPQAAFAVPGSLQISIKLTDGTTATTVLSITGTVIRTETDSAVDPGEILPDLAELQAAAQEALDAADDATDAAADARSAAQSGVRYDAAQSLTDAQKEQARTNIGAASAGDVSDLKSAIQQLNYFDSHSATEGYTKVQDGTFSPTSGYYDSNMIKCYPSTAFVIIEEKKSSAQALNRHDLAISFYNASGTWVQGSANYTVTSTEISAAQSIFGYGGWKYTFTTPDNQAIAYWSVYYDSVKWSNFGLYCFYGTDLGNYKFSGLTPLSAIYQDRLIPMGWIEGLSDEFDDVTADMTMSVRMQSAYSDWSDFDLGYLDNNGAIVQPYANAYTSDYIAVTPGSLVEYKLRIIGNSKMSGVAWYDANKNHLGSALHVGDSGASWYTETGSVTLPNTARYIRFSGRKYDADLEKSQYVTYYTDEKIKDYLSAETASNPWAGKKWVAFGTSITDTANSLGPEGTPTGKYVPYLQKLSGMSVINKGIAGGTLGVVSGVTTGNIMTAIKSSSNLAAIQAADIITIEGFVNDFVANLPIGEISDTTNTTMTGALYEAVTYLYSQNDDATIVLITESTGQHIDSSHTFPVTRANSLGKYQYEYNDAIITMARYLGCHVIDAGQKSQINQWHTEYLADWIHHSELGGKQYAETIWDELKNIHCNSDVSVE